MQVDRVADAITKWLNDYAKNARMKGFVVELVAVLIAQSLLPYARTWS
jgi:hypothetical protein